ELFDLESQPRAVEVEIIEFDLQAVQKQGYDHFLIKEIFEQPESLRATLGGRVKPETGQVKLGGLNMSDDELRAIKHIIFVGCGTAHYAGILGKYFAEQFLDDVTFSVEIASELRYRSFAIPENTIAVVVSQSGETADTLACLQELKRRGVPTLGVINTVGSTIAREVDGGI
ncbi:MAG TPA: SIS domain-containing protein, partial [Candidatus Saccharibacteria bacterium]|nr:SIS domain-containing protein [Candidatus Saccharibacteria bacterium]